MNSIKPQIFIVLFLILFVSSFFSIFSSDQPAVICLSFEEAKERGIDITALRKKYIPAFSGGSTECAFPGQGEEVGKAFGELIGLVKNRLKMNKKNDFDGIIIFNYFFFNKNGKIEYYIFRIKDKALSISLCEALRHVAAGYQFPLKASRKFSQCGKFKIK